jgi:low temperature requirement protein LtrA
MKIKYDNYFDLKQFVIAFKKAIKKLKNLDISPPELWYLILFIIALFDVWPI